jgi:hypothetical protein
MTNEEAPLPPVRTVLNWSALDLDSTLSTGIWTPDDPTRRIGAPIEANVAKLLELVQAGWKIAIHTSRPWSDYETIELWLRFHRIPYQLIVCGKLLAGKYVDDRAINAEEGSWL